MGPLRSVSVLLRLAPQALSSERLAGRVEIVETGEVGHVRDADELMAFLRERREGTPADTAQPPSQGP